MTNEEAIKEIQDASDYEVRHGDIEHHHEDIMRRVEAFEKAVNALQKEPVYFPPCVDCNTKMNEIREAYDKLKKQEPCEELFDDWREAPSYAMTLEQAREAVHELRKEIVKLRKEPCEDAIIIPRGATNGDVLTTIFPDLNFTNVLAKMYAQNGKMLLEWWNTPYKRTEG